MSKFLEIKEKGMFYTKDAFSRLLVENIAVKRAKNILELGVGDGSLIRFAAEKWKNAKFTCTDINSDEFLLGNTKANVKFQIESGLNVELGKKLRKETKEFDVAICNPPYLKVSVKDKELYKGIIKKFDGELFDNLRLISSEVIFLIQNMLLLKDCGILGIILPDGILTRKEFEPIRRSIITKYNLLSAIELPDRIFNRTDAKTHILVLKKEKPTSCFVQVCLANKLGVITDEILVPRNNLIERMDFKFLNHNLTNANEQNLKTLSKYNITVLRGNITHAELKVSKQQFIHSTSFKNGSLISVPNATVSKKYRHKNFASGGDLVMVRVGRGCVGKLARVKDGSFLVSDCIFVFKSENKKGIDQLETYLKSKAGKQMIGKLVHGTCSKVISKTDVEKILKY